MAAFTLPGRPVPAARLTRRALWTPRAKRHLAHKAAIGWAAKAAGVRLLTGPVRVSCRFYVHGGNVPDSDNCLKAVLDGLQGVAYANDRQVVDARGVRLVAWTRDAERTEVEVGEVEEGDGDGAA